MTSVASQLRFGFKQGINGAHASRTMMLAELSGLFQARDVSTRLEQYQKDVKVFNVLHKPKEKARNLTWRHLVALYGMDLEIPLFRAFRRLWDSDEQARPVLACQMALARDPLLRESMDKILSLELGHPLAREDMEALFVEKFPDRYSPAMLKSLAQNINGTWTNAGYLKGSKKKVRSEPIIRPSNVAFALFLGYLQGASGNRLFTTDWARMLKCRTDRLLEHARMASHSGLITFKHSSEVIEVSFPDYLTREEEAWLNE